MLKLFRSVEFLVLAAMVAVALAVSTGTCSAQETDDEESKLFRALGYGTYAAFGGDALSTELGLSTGLGYEANPFMQNRGVRLSTHVAIPVLVNYATAKAYRDGNKKLALWMRIGFVAGYGYLTAHNLRQWNRVR